MPVKTDYARHAARLARKICADAELGSAQPDAEFYRVLAKALDEIAESVESIARQE